MKDVKGTKEEDKTPPAWFTSYMEKVKKLLEWNWRKSWMVLTLTPLLFPLV